MISLSTQLVVGAMIPLYVSGIEDTSWLVDLTRKILPEVLNTVDGSVTHTNRVSFSTDRTAQNISELAEKLMSRQGSLSHVIGSGYGEWTANDLHTRVSKGVFTCLCADLGCTTAVAADLKGAHNPNAGLHRQSGPLILRSPNGEPMPCLSLQMPIKLNETRAVGCKLLNHTGSLGELLVSECEGGTISSFGIMDNTTDQLVASSLSAKDFTVKNAGPNVFANPRVSLGDLLGDIDIKGPVMFRIPVNEYVNVGGIRFPVNFNLEFNAAESMEKVASSFANAAIDSVIGGIWYQDFNEKAPASEAGQDEIMQLLFRFALYGLRQSQHTSFEKQESRQLEAMGQYMSILEGRPDSVSLTEVITNAVVLIAAMASWGWSVGHAIKTRRQRQNSQNQNVQNAQSQSWLDLSTVASLAGSSVMLFGAVSVFVLQWGQMAERLAYAESMIIIESLIFSRTGTLFFARIHRDFDLLSVAVYTVDVQDVSADYTWLFVLGTMLTVTTLGVSLILGERDNPGNLVARRWFKCFAVFWIAAVVFVPLVVGLTSDNGPEKSMVPSPVLSTPAPSPSPSQFPTKENETLMDSGPPIFTNMPSPSLTTYSPGAISCKNCCKGRLACTGNEGTIRDNSCNGDYACQNNRADIRAGSCNGRSACQNIRGTILDGSCNGNYVCSSNTGTVGVGSCIGRSACQSNKGVIGERSCNDNYACSRNEGRIGSSSCNGRSACGGNDSVIGNDVCNENYGC